VRVRSLPLLSGGGALRALLCSLVEELFQVCLQHFRMRAPLARWRRQIDPGVQRWPSTAAARSGTRFAVGGTAPAGATGAAGLTMGARGGVRCAGAVRWARGLGATLAVTASAQARVVSALD
jgi:hypothetical protein